MKYMRMLSLLLLAVATLPSMLWAQNPQAPSVQCQFEALNLAVTFPKTVSPQVREAQNGITVRAEAGVQGTTYKLVARTSPQTTTDAVRLQHFKVYADTYMQALGDAELKEEKRVQWLGREALQMSYSIPNDGTVLHVVHRFQLTDGKAIVAELYRPGEMPSMEDAEEFFGSFRLTTPAE